MYYPLLDTDYEVRNKHRIVFLKTYFSLTTSEPELKIYFQICLLLWYFHKFTHHILPGANMQDIKFN